MLPFIFFLKKRFILLFLKLKFIALICHIRFFKIKNYWFINKGSSLKECSAGGKFWYHSIEEGN
jgi:hypothetical protein